MAGVGLIQHFASGVRAFAGQDFDPIIDQLNHITGVAEHYNFNQIAMLGDSRAAASYDTYSPTDNTSPNQTGLGGTGISQYLLARSHGALQMFSDSGAQFNYTLTGITTTRLLSEGYVAAACASAAGTVLLWIGINDANQHVSTPLSLANILTIDNMLAAAGKFRIWISETPKGYPTPTFDASENKAHMAIYNAIRSLASRPYVSVIDAWPSISDQATGAWKSAGDSIDGTHPDSYGGDVLAKLIWDQVGAGLPPMQWAPASILDLYDSSINTKGILNDGPFFAGTGGSATVGASGTVAAGWTITTSNAAITATCSKTTDSNGQICQRIVLGGTAPGSGSSYCRIFRVLTASELAVGNKIQAITNYTIADGHAGLVSVGSPRIKDVTNDLTYASGVLGSGASVLDGRPGWANAVGYTQPYLLPSPLPTIRVEMYFYLGEGSSPSATIDVSLLGVRKI